MWSMSICVKRGRMSLLKLTVAMDLRSFRAPALDQPEVGAVIAATARERGLDDRLGKRRQAEHHTDRAVEARAGAGACPGLLEIGHERAALRVELLDEGPDG